jgi:hypothetical protein
MRHAPARRERQGWLVRLRTAKGDDRVDATPFALGVDPSGVVPLIHGARLGTESARMHGVEQGRNEVRFLPLAGFNSPCHRQTCCRADRHVQLVSVERSGAARPDRAPVSPCCIGVAETLAFRPVLADVPLPIRPGRNVAGIYRNVTPKILMLAAQGSGARVEARTQGWVVRTK